MLVGILLSRWTQRIRHLRLHSIRNLKAHLATCFAIDRRTTMTFHPRERAIIWGRGTYRSPTYAPLATLILETLSKNPSACDHLHLPFPMSWLFFPLKAPPSNLQVYFPCAIPSDNVGGAQWFFMSGFWLQLYVTSEVHNPSWSLLM